MSPADKSTTPDRTAAWWQRELPRTSALARQWLGRRYPSIRHLHEDLIAETVAQLTEYLLSRPAGLPVSWFAAPEPLGQDAQRFRALLFTILGRRIQDQFRADFRRWIALIPLHELADNTDSDAAGGMDARRLVIGLLQVLATLPDADRKLMEHVALGGAERPLDVAERKRADRLRQRLRRELGEKLGQDPNELPGNP